LSMLKIVGLALVAVTVAQVPVTTASAYAPTPKADAPTKVGDFIPVAPTASTCEVPWPVNGMGYWTDCIPETHKAEGESCTYEKPFNYDCVYDSGAIACNALGKFEELDANGKSRGPNYCTKIPHPADGQGCARHDRDYAMCTNTEGCHWDGERSWCAINCRKVSCGTEFHRRDVSCQFNCPLHNITECTPWQAGCGCIQDTAIKDCGAWCMDNNDAEFIWLPTATMSSQTIDSSLPVRAVKMTVASSLTKTNEAGYDAFNLCKDACFQRGVCISPKAVIV